MIDINPLLKGSPVKQKKRIHKSVIIDSYINSYNIDVSKFFVDLEFVSLYECNATGYQFYYPQNTLGDGKFYAKLQKFEWYYMPWKWEHQQTLKLAKPGMKILEVGCAEGHFLRKLFDSDQTISTVGLELNEQAIKAALQNNLTVFNETIQHHALSNSNKYDIVCSFQVLEHIAEVHSFLDSQIKCLKKGGQLVIGVPNNDSFLKLDSLNSLNLPPHHMGLWKAKSLQRLTNYFPLKLIRTSYEPLQEYHKGYFRHVVNTYINNMTSGRLGFVGKIIHRLFKNSILRILYLRYPKLENYTILVQFQKI